MVLKGFFTMCTDNPPQGYGGNYWDGAFARGGGQRACRGGNLQASHSHPVTAQDLDLTQGSAVGAGQSEVHVPR